MSTGQTVNTSVIMHYPDDAFLCCPPCKVPRKDLSLTLYIGPIQPGDSNNRTLSYYQFASVPFGFPCNPGSSGFGGCGSQPIVTITWQYVKRIETDQQTLVYNPTINMWGPTDWYYSQGVTMTGDGRSSGIGPLGSNPPDVDISVDQATYTFTRWSATCAGNAAYGIEASGFRFPEGVGLILYQEQVSFVGKSTDDPQDLFDAWLNSPSLTYLKQVGTTQIIFTQTGFFDPNYTYLAQCSPFLYQRLNKPLPGRPVTGITLTNAS